MEINGKSETPLSAAQSKETNGRKAAASTAKPGGSKARASRTSKNTKNGVRSSVLERINDGILAFDSGLNYTYINERAGELLGCEANDLVGRSLWEAHPDANGAPFAEACRRALETQTIISLNGYFPASDRWLEGRVYPSEDGVSVLFSEGEGQGLQDNRREQRYRILFDTMQEGFLLAEVIQDKNGEAVDARFLEVNASMANFFRKSRGELIGQTAGAVLPLDEHDLEILKRACRVGLGKEEPFFIEDYAYFLNCWFRGHVFSPKPGQFATLLTDVTEQKETEERIRDISNIPGENPNPVIRFTREGEILYANPASITLLEAWKNRENHTTSLAEIQGQLASVLEQGHNTEIELIYDSTFYTGLLVPVQEQGYINLYLRDITERRQVEETLRAHINQTNAGITRADLEGRFTFVNRTFCAMLGYSEHELVGKTIWEFSHPDDIHKNKRMFERMAREGESFQLEKRILRRNGSILWINVGTSPLRDARGRIHAATSIVVDITRRKRAEESLLDSARRSLYLSSLSDAIRPLSDPARIRTESVRLLGNHLRASRVAYLEVGPDGSTQVRGCYADGIPEISGQFDLGACVPAEQISKFRAGRTVYASDIPDDARFSGPQKACQQDMSSRAQILVPFVRNGQVLAALCIQHSQPRNWKNEELAVVEETAERLQAAIERARAEQDLRDSEERLRLASRAAGMCTWELNLQDQSYKLGQNFADVLGFPADILPENRTEVTELLNIKEDLLTMQEAIDQAIASHTEPPPLQFRVVNPLTEDILWLEVNATLVYDEEDRPQRMFGMVQNITERKRAEQGLAEFARQQEALYRLADRLNRTESLEDVFDPALDAILSALQCDRASILLYDDSQVMRFVTWRGLSDAYRQATDGHSPWTPDTMNPEPISMDDVGTAGLEEPLKSVVLNEGIGGLAFIPLVSGGKLIGKFMVYFNGPHNFTEDELQFSLTIARQLASSIERKRAEKSLRASEALYRTIARSIPGGGVYVVDRDFRYLVAEGPVTEAFGLSRAMLEGRTVMEIFPDERGIRMEERLRRNFAGETVDFETRFNGRVYWTQQAPLFHSIGQAIILTLDITERKQAEEALRQSEERFTQFMQHLPGLAWIKDVQGHYIYANPAAEKVFGAVHKEIYGKTDQEIFPEDIAAQFRKNDQQALQGKKGIQAVETLQHEDGVLHYSLVSKFPIPGPDGSPALIGGTAFDITERIQMEDALKGAREKAEESAYRIARLQKVTAALSEFLTPSQVAKVVVEQGAPALGAVSSSVMVLSDDGQSLEIKHSAAPEPVLRPYAKFAISLNVPAADALRSGQPVWIESRQQYLERYPHLAEQIHHWGHQAVLAIPMAYKGGTLGVLTMSFDRVLPHSPEDQEYALTLARQGAQAFERARAEEALRDSEERYRAIISQATAGIVRKDAEGRLLFVNQAFCNMLDLLDTELIGKTMWELTHEEDVEENKRLFHRLMAEGIPFQLDKRLIRRDGSILWVNVSVSPVMDASGKPYSAVSVYVDVTRHKLAENRLGLLAKVSEMTRQFEESDELLFAVAREIGEHFHVRRSLFNEIDLENNRVVVHRDYCRGVNSIAGTHKVSEYSSSTSAALMAGMTVVNHDSKEDPRTALDYESFYAKQGERAYVAVPLMQEDSWVASLRISDDRPREWDIEDIQLLKALTDRTWTAAERLRIDRALRDSEERLRVTFNTTAVGFAMLKPDTSFVEVNDAFCDMVGYSRQELLGMNIAHLTHPGYLKSTRDHIDRLLAGEVPSFSVEKLYIRGDGVEIWVQKSFSLVREVDGSPQHLIAICQDITERRRVDEELRQLNLELEERVLSRTTELQSAYEFLRESEATSRLIIESMPDAIVITDQDGRIVHANRQVESLFGYTSNEILGQQVEILLPERFRGGHEKYRGSYSGQRSRRIMGLGLDLFGRRKDESEFPVDVMLSPIDNKTAWDVMVSIRDSTKQREAQEALRTNEEKLRTLFEILPAGVSFLDREGRINDMNPALTKILGLSKQELLKDTFASRQYIRADGTPMSPAEFASRRAVTEQKTVYNVETGIVRENGEIIWTSVNAAPVEVADVEVAVVTIDITERKKAEEALHRHRERLKVLSRRLVEIQEEERRAIARELHDRVGQNLAALTLNLNILRSQLTSEDLERIGSRLSDSVNLVNDILAITRSVMSDLRPNVLDDYGLDAALNEYADRFAQRFGIPVSIRTPATPLPRLEPSLEMTLLRIAQEALTNIARHAQARQAVISLNVEKDALHLAVEDNGVGILSWQKVNQPGSHGLLIMRERAEAFGGSLKVNSTYKNGTRIEVMIPLGSSPHKKVSQERHS